LRADGEPISEREKGGTTVQNSAESIAIMKEVSAMGAEVLEAAGKMAKSGVTTDEIDRVVHEKCIELGCYPSPLNYKLFPKSCCTSVNETICHGIPDLRVLEDGDIVNVDVSVYYKGHHTDLNETWLIGNVKKIHQELVQTTYECLEKAIAICRPGQMYRELGNAISKHAHKHGFSVVKSYCGHGVGKLFHGAPNVPHYANNRAIGVMKVGHIFTIEPMINHGHWQDKTWPDDWTVTTTDGTYSAQFEHTILITETGCDVLTRRKNGTYIDRF
jgi:methionyl aminopeptidase